MRGHLVLLSPLWDWETESAMLKNFPKVSVRGGGRSSSAWVSVRCSFPVCIVKSYDIGPASGFLTDLLMNILLTVSQLKTCQKSREDLISVFGKIHHTANIAFYKIVWS